MGGLVECDELDNTLGELEAGRRRRSRRSRGVVGGLVAASVLCVGHSAVSQTHRPWQQETPTSAPTSASPLAPASSETSICAVILLICYVMLVWCSVGMVVGGRYDSDSVMWFVSPAVVTGLWGETLSKFTKFKFFSRQFEPIDR